jgi:transcriptional accessory protein Tex/SPT6
VKVLEIDVPRKRIALSMKKEAPMESNSGKSEQVQVKRSHKSRQVKAPAPAQGSMANALPRNVSSIKTPID